MGDQPVIERIGDLTPDPRNARRHNDRNVETIVRALQEVGAARSIVVDEVGVILAGNATVEAAAAAGIERVQVVEADGETIVAVRRSGLTPEQKAKLALYDNRAAELADWDGAVLAGLAEELDLSGLFFEDELAGILAGLDEPRALGDPDAVPEPPVEPTTRPGDLWRLGEHRLLCGDATDPAVADRLLDGQRPACVFTSPPYAVGVDYGATYDDTINELRALLRACAPLWLRHLEAGGYAVVNFGDIAPARDVAEVDEPCEYPMALEYWPVFRAAGYVLWSRRVWCKPNPRVHAPWCIQSNRAATDWEHVWTWKAPGSSRIGRIDGRSPLGWVDTTREEGVAVGKDEHGAGMATLVAIRAVEIHSGPREVVWEPFGGTGTTLIASESLGRRCFATEINPAYCDVIVRRWEQFTGRTAELAR